MGATMPESTAATAEKCTLNSSEKQQQNKQQCARIGEQKKRGPELRRASSSQQETVGTNWAGVRVGQQTQMTHFHFARQTTRGGAEPHVRGFGMKSFVFLP